MSPFPLPSGEWVSCTSGRYQYPFEHSVGCPCPCAMCVDIQRRVLLHEGLLDADVSARHLFLYALGDLAVSAPLGDDDDRDGSFNVVYREICERRDVREANPAATYGWLTPTADPHLLTVVTVPSDPYKEDARVALENWAQEQGVRLRNDQAAI